ncbi:hypothetical protein K432DRAFT_413236 [Lepidopterella palustris CBS 459.81]|uniref:Metallo-beta-lactamase domain-containing protein n=1 Tax=Lepidopterella palustris CBS 459.81 TaxID=1314670 RepID=A0A8E2EKB4_9PEZI|nr:hypothetical protein K432DRAFT_413236 [Lepidopterella palustris CBS 459.81]
MSAFKSVVAGPSSSPTAQFPQIRIDYFRPVPGQRPPLACFLSNVHSDHLQGLESLKSPFIYCSPTTREISRLVELICFVEQYPHRLKIRKRFTRQPGSDFQAFEESPKTASIGLSIIGLSPGNDIRAIISDANPCAGSVMFLIWGDGKAILYAGGIRYQTWWVHSLVQNPVSIPFAIGSHRLDCIYLNTTCAKSVRKLLEKEEICPEKPFFYFHSWTFGYENVWIILSSIQQNRMYLGQYRWKIYKSLTGIANGVESGEEPPLYVFSCGNHYKSGFLT